MKKYFFVLGNNPKLSLAELSALFPNNKWELGAFWALSDFPQELDVNKLISVLGGTIKIGEISKIINLANRHALASFLKKDLREKAEQKKDGGKFNFGFSFYGQQKIAGDFFKLGLAIKKDLKQAGISSRMVVSREVTLSSVVVEQNKLIDQGQEICLISTKNKVYVGKTLAVQDFKALSKRDFGRPNRDDYSGMLPPKLAQIMINLARRDDKNFAKKIIFDPFCGSATVLMEAYLMGFKNIIGSDLSAKAIFDSEKNIAWLLDLKKEKEKIKFNIFQSDVLNLDSHLKKESIDYIVCEPYLGPSRDYKKFEEVVLELNELYSKALPVLYNLLSPKGRLCMIWPHFRVGGKTWEVRPHIFKFKRRAVLKYETSEGQKEKQESLVYGRPEQKVWREIIILEK